MGGMIHIAMHAFGKITLFFCAGAIFVATGPQEHQRNGRLGTAHAGYYGRLSDRQPQRQSVCPPCGGFLSKWYLLLGALDAHQTVFLAVLLVSSLLNAAYFLPVVYRAYFVTLGEARFESGIVEAPLWCLAPLVLTALISLVLFFYPHPFMELARLAVSQVMAR